MDNTPCPVALTYHITPLNELASASMTGPSGHASKEDALAALLRDMVGRIVLEHLSALKDDAKTLGIPSTVLDQSSDDKIKEMLVSHPRVDRERVLNWLFTRLQDKDDMAAEFSITPLPNILQGLEITVLVEGGGISRAFCNNHAVMGASLHVLDSDTDGADPERIVRLTSEDNRTRSYYQETVAVESMHNFPLTEANSEETQS